MMVIKGKLKDLKILVTIPDTYSIFGEKIPGCTVNLIPWIEGRKKNGKRSTKAKA